MHTLLAALPALLGFAGLAGYLIMKSRQPPSPVLLQIIEVIRQRGGALPSVDARLSGRLVFQLLNKHAELRESLTANEVKLLEGVRTSEGREHARVTWAFTATILISIVLFAFFGGGDRERRPIESMTIAFDIRYPVAELHGPAFDKVKAEAQTLLDECMRDNVDPIQRFSQIGGQLLRTSSASSSSTIDAYTVEVMVGSDLSKRLAKAVDAIGAPPLDFIAIIAVASPSGSQFGYSEAMAEAKMPSASPWVQLITAGNDSVTQPLHVAYNFAEREVRYRVFRWADIERPKHLRMKFWDEMPGTHMILSPMAMERTHLSSFSVSSSLGPEASASGDRITQGEHLVEDEPCTFFRVELR
jgi:hypothetical protein